MIRRRVSKPIQVGDVQVGGGAQVVVQSMTKTDTRDVAATIDQIHRLKECGCEIVRVAIPDMEAAEALARIKRNVSIPLIADIHFDHRLALAALERGADQVRINPGNIPEPERIAAVVRSAKERNIPLRIGVNAGSMPKKKQGMENREQEELTSRTRFLATQMAEVVLEQVDFIEGLGFDLIEVSLKAFDVLATVEANRIVAERIPYPIHLGITESGPPRTGGIRSAAGLAILLYQGIGDSLRVSLSTPDPCEEVFVGYEILKSLELRQGPVLVSCPTCGRCEIKGFFDLVHEVEKLLAGFDKPIKVAVMGCEVNGPGEAKDADLGLACGKGRGLIFKKGKKVRAVEEQDFLAALVTELEKFRDNGGNLE